MTMDNFLCYLQQLLTMVDSRNDCSISLAKTALLTILSLAKTSGKANGIVLKAMIIADRKFEYLVEHKDEFAGVPGEYQNNHVKRKRLADLVSTRETTQL